MTDPPPTIVPRGADQILILRNPRAGAQSNQRTIEALVSGLRDDRFQVELFDAPADLKSAADAWQGSGRLRVVIAAGGDGTLALVANLLAPEIPISVFPLGTENLVAKNFGFRTAVDSMRRVVQAAVVRRADAGQADGRLFLLMVGCGFDADVVRRVHQHRRGHIRHWSYLKPIWDSLRSYNYPELRVTSVLQTAEGQEEYVETRCHWAFVFNLPKYAVGLRIAPAADGADGQLDVCTFRGGSLPLGLYHFGTVWLGCHGAWSGSARWRVTSVRIEADGDVPYQMDGDPGGVLPVDIRVLRGRLSLMVPEGPVLRGVWRGLTL